MPYETERTQNIKTPPPKVLDWVRSRFRIDYRNIGRIVFPLVQFIETEKPDRIIALDTGGRITAFAVHNMYQSLYGNLPTVDRCIRFKRVSKSCPVGFVIDTIKQDIEELLVVKPDPHLMFIDDSILTGKTSKMLREIIAKLSNGRVRVSFGVMREATMGHADVSGATFSFARFAWHNNPDLIGIKYRSPTNPYPLRTPASRELRSNIARNIKSFAAYLVDD